MRLRNGIRIRPEEILGISRDATPREIRRARGRLAKMLHPDLHDGQGNAIMQLINHAVEVMMTGQQGDYTFGGGGEQGGPAPGPDSSPPPRDDPRQGSTRGGGQQGGQKQECPHPKKPGYSQCFKCSGVQPCRCGDGYYRPPNDRCRSCRVRGGGPGRQGGYRGGQRGRRG